MAEEKGGLRWWVDLVLRRSSRDQVVKDLDRTAQEGSARAKRSFRDMWDSFQKSGSAAIAKVGGTLAGLFALNKIRQFGSASVEEFEKASLAAGRLKGMWDANSGAVGRSLEELKAFSAEMQSATLLSADDLDLAIAQLLSYKSIVGDTFERTIELGADMASVFGSMTQSTAALAKALDDPINGLGLLARAGFTFEDATKAQVQAMVEQGRLFDAQKLLLAELEREMGGVARSMKTGWVAVKDDIGKAFSELKIQTGAAIAAAIEGEDAGAGIIDTIRALTTAITENAHVIRVLGQAIVWLTVKPVQGLLLLLDDLGDVIAGLVNGSIWVFQLSLAKLGEGFAWTLRIAEKFYDFVGKKERAASVRERISEIDEWVERMKQAADVSRQAAAMNFGAVAAPQRTRRPDVAPTKTTGTRSTGTPDPAVIDNTKEQIALLKALHDLEQLTAKDRELAEQIDARLTKRLAQGNLTMAERVELYSQLRDMDTILDRHTATVSEQIGALTALHNANALTNGDRVLAEQLEAQLTAELREGNLTLARRAELTGQLATLSGILHTTTSQQIDMLQRTQRLGRLTAEDLAEASRIQQELTSKLQAGNLPLAERLDLLEQLKAVEDTLEADRRAGIDQWLSANQELVSGAEAVAYGMARAFEDSFALILRGGEQMSEGFKTFFRGMGGAVMGGIAEIARGHMRKALALGLEETAAAFGRLALGDAAGAAMHFKAAAGYGATATAWAALGGAAGGAQTNLSGSGGYGPRGVHDRGGHIADRTDRPRQQVIIMIDPLNPHDPVFQETTYAGMQYARERFGDNAEIVVKPRTQGRA